MLRRLDPRTDDPSASATGGDGTATGEGGVSPGARDERAAETAVAPADRLHGLLTGAVAGAFATVVMTVYRAPLARALPPTAEFWAKFVAGGDPEDHPLPALALHLLYGIGGGAAFGFLRPERRRLGLLADADDGGTGGPSGTDADGDTDAEKEAESELSALIWGLAYAAVLSVFGERVVLGAVLDMDLSADESLVFHAGHLIYGAALGAWVGSRRHRG